MEGSAALGQTRAGQKSGDQPSPEERLLCLFHCLIVLCYHKPSTALLQIPSLALIAFPEAENSGIISSVQLQDVFAVLLP